MEKELANNPEICTNSKRRTTFRIMAAIFYVLAAALTLTFIVYVIVASLSVTGSSFPLSYEIIIAAVLFFSPAIQFFIGACLLKKRFGLTKAERDERYLQKHGKPRPKMTKKKIISLIAIIFASFWVLYTVIPSLILHLYINHHVSYSGNSYLQMVFEPSDFDMTTQVMYLDTSDGEKLRAYSVTGENPKAVVINISGIEQPSVTYFFPQAEMLLDEGIDSFLLELRAHGESSGNQIGLGYTEIEDVRAAVDYLKGQERYKNVPIIIQGVSMGGAVSLNSFGEIPDIYACIAMSSYASFEDELDLAMETYAVPKIIRNYQLFFFRSVLVHNFGEEAVNSFQPKKEIKKADGRPVLLIAAKNDSSVPVKNTQLISFNNRDAEPWYRDSADHFIIRNSAFTDVESDTEYCEKILEFINGVVFSYSVKHPAE